jgi:hypothetical protein
MTALTNRCLSVGKFMLVHIYLQKQYEEEVVQMLQLFPFLDTHEYDYKYGRFIHII